MKHLKKILLSASVALIFSNATLALELKSSAFINNDILPIQYTCNGAQLSPPLTWSDVPENTKSFALTLYDPDAPHGTFTHWILYNIPSNINELSEDAVGKKQLPETALSGKSNWPLKDYVPPCPPKGTHHYIFKLYALDTVLKLKQQPDLNTLQRQMQKHTLATATLLTTYSKNE